MKTFYSILRGIVFILGAGVIAFIMYLNLKGSSFMPLTETELVEFQTNNILFYIICLAVLVIIIAVCYFAFRNSDSFFSEKGTLLFFLIGTAIYLAVGLYLIFRIPTTLRADAGVIYEAAEQIKNGDFSSLVIDKAAPATAYSTGYLAKNPHQIGLAIVLSLFLRILPNVRFVFILNLILILLNNLLMLNISDSLFHHSDRADFLTVLLSFLFFPQFFLCIYCYGIIPGLTALLISFLALIRFEKRGGILSALLVIIAAACAVVLRSNYMIGVIAEIILVLLVFIRSLATDDDHVSTGRFRYLITAIFLIIALLIPNLALRIGIQQVSGTKIDNSVPMNAWVAMGLSEGPRAEGWYNGYVYTSFADNGYDEKATQEAAGALIRERLDTMKSDHDYAYTFFMRKLASTWSEPTFQSAWIGPQGDTAQEIGGLLFHDFYTGGASYDIYFLVCSIIYTVLLAGCVLFLLRRLIRWIRHIGDRYDDVEGPSRAVLVFPLLFLLGGFLFHLGWETKSLYVMCYVYMLLPYAARGLSFGD